jgi:hypothetical protein
MNMHAFLINVLNHILNWSISMVYTHSLYGNGHVMWWIQITETQCLCAKRNCFDKYMRSTGSRFIVTLYYPLSRFITHCHAYCHAYCHALLCYCHALLSWSRLLLLLSHKISATSTLKGTFQQPLNKFEHLPNALTRWKLAMKLS